MVLGTLPLILLVAGPDATTSRPAPPRPGLSWTLADGLSRKLEALEKRGRVSRPATKPARADSVQVTQEELNSYLNLTLAPRLPEGLSDVDFAFEQGRIAAKATIDLDRVKGRLPPAGPLSPLSYLAGRVPVELRGRLSGDGGFGVVELEDVRLGGFTVPPSLLAQLVAQSTRSAGSPQGFDILAPFRLPYAVRRIRIQPGRALLEL